MHIETHAKTVSPPPEQFQGSVWLDLIAYPRDAAQTMVVAKVHFAPRARTAWHSHVRGQTLHITHGVAWIGVRGGERVEAHAGQTIYCPPGEIHWHGASPDSFMEHLGMVDNADDPTQTTTWLEHVTDEDYYG